LLFHPLDLANSTFLPDIPEKIDGNFSFDHNKNGRLVDGEYPVHLKTKDKNK